MLNELAAENFLRTLPLYEAAGHNFPLIHAVVEGQQRGQVFVDDAQEPRAAVVITNFGFTYVFGAEQTAAFDAGLTELLTRPERIRPTYLLWYDPPTLWQQRLAARPPDVVRRRERIRLEWPATRKAAAARCPPGFELRLLTEELLPRVERFGLQLESRFWSSAADLLTQGLGVLLLKGDEAVSLCYAACVAGGRAEVDVITAPEYRGQGLGTLAAQEFIEECLRRGLRPTWDCFVSNPASLKLAERLGFEQVRAYTFYSFNVPLRLAEGADE
jgi:GNAT superfamily N-acetyltransferase